MITETAHSGQFAWTDSPGDTYLPDSWLTSLTLAQPLDLSGADRVRLTFWQRHLLGPSVYDEAGCLTLLIYKATAEALTSYAYTELFN